MKVNGNMPRVEPFMGARAGHEERITLPGRRFVRLKLIEIREVVPEEHT